MCTKCQDPYFGQKVVGEGKTAADLAADLGFLGMLESICEDILQLVSVGVEILHAKARSELIRVVGRKRTVDRVSLTQFVRRVFALQRKHVAAR